MERLIAYAQSLGAAQCAFEDAVRYATQRIQFGKPIGKEPAHPRAHHRHVPKDREHAQLGVQDGLKIDNGESVQIDSAVAKL